MAKFYSFFLLLVMGLACRPAEAQRSFQAGYLVQLAGDTLRGEISARDVRASQQQCSFRPTATAEVVTYLPVQLRAYGFCDAVGHCRHYRALARPGAPTQYFMQALASGPASLYFFRDEEQADHYYVATAALPLTELIYRKVLLEEEHRFQEQNTYRQTLAQALPGCQAAQAMLPALRFTARELTQAVAAYNHCQQPQVALKLVPRYRPHLGVVLGFKRTTMGFRYQQGNYVLTTYELALGPDSAPVGGLALNVPLPLLNHRLSLEAELLYESQRYSQTYLNQYGTGESYHYEFDLPTLRLPLLVRYTAPQGRVRPLLEAGPVLAYMLQNTSTVARVSATGTTGAAANFYSDNLNRLEEGIAGGAGVRFNYWQGRQAALLARYEYTFGLVAGNGLAAWSSHFMGLLAIDLTN